jgi:predicted RNase H-like HicB family nuclease
MKYLIVIEPTATGYSTWSPDVPGCVAVGSTPEETKRNMHDAMSFHFDGLRAEQLPIPSSTSTFAYVDVPDSTP